MAGNEIINGFHGTNLDNVESILKNGLYKSKDSDTWLGPGIYFFLDFFGDPIQNAKDWAITEAIKKHRTRGKVEALKLEYAVLKADIIKNENQCIDFRTPDGANLFNFIADELLKKLKSDDDKLDNIPKGEIDGFVSKWIHEHFGYCLFIANRSIQISDFRRFECKGYWQRQANCTICAVYDSELITNLELIEKGVML